MIIRKIVLTNYRQYTGRQEISFGFEKDKNINIIVGVNGSGKTNLLNALTWCLYGREEHLAEASVHHEMLDDNVRAALKPSETAEVSVEIILENEKGWGFRVVRRKLFLKGKENNISSVNEEQTAFIKLPHKKDWDLSPLEFIINYKILPEGVKDFFFFDGERLIKLFEEKTAEKVKNAILNVSQISLIDATLDHLEKKKVEYYRESKNISPKVKELGEKIEAIKKALQQLKIEIEEYQKSKHEIEKIIKDIEKRLMGYSEERIRELECQYQELEKEKELLREKIEEYEENFKEFLLSNAPVALLSNALRITQKLINKKYDKGELPPPATEEFLREILDRGRCICGTDISKGEARKKVEDFLETISAIATKLDEECRAIKPEIKNVFNIAESFLEEKKKLGQEVAEKKRELEKINEKLREISLKLKKLNIDEIKNLVEQKDSYLQQKEEIIGNLRIAQDRMNNGERQIKEWESELKKELKKEEKLKKLTTKIDIVEICLRVLKEVKNEILEEVGSTVEKFTFQYFEELIWKKKKFKEVKINENYMVSVFDRFGNNIIGVMSAGEKEILALSFMGALRKISGFEAPIIIDTPLARISKEHRINITSALPKYLQDTQIILLFTDEEFTEEVKKILQSRIITKHFLKYNDELDETEVVKWDGNSS